MKQEDSITGPRALIFALLSSLTGCSTALPSRAPEGLPRFALVEEGRVWRGGQPTERGLDYLKGIGVRRIIKLNAARLEWEKREAEKRGMTVVSYPISFLRQTLGSPDSGRFCAVCYALRSPEKTYIHCTHGQDRTGLMVGYYRTLVQEKDRATAYGEMCDYGFHTSLRGLVRTWNRGAYLLERTKSPVRLSTGAASIPLAGFSPRREAFVRRAHTRTGTAGSGWWNFF